MCAAAPGFHVTGDRRLSSDNRSNDLTLHPSSTYLCLCAFVFVYLTICVFVVLVYLYVYLYVFVYCVFVLQRASSVLSFVLAALNGVS